MSKYFASLGNESFDENTTVSLAVILLPKSARAGIKDGISRLSYAEQLLPMIKAVSEDANLKGKAVTVREDVEEDDGNIVSSFATTMTESLYEITRAVIAALSSNDKSEIMLANAVYARSIHHWREGTTGERKARKVQAKASFSLPK